MLRFLAILAFAFLAEAHAQVMPPPNGWTAEADAESLTWTTTASSSDTNIAIAFDRIDSSAQPIESWFKSQIDQLAGAAVVTQRSGIVREGTLLKDAFILEQDGVKMRSYVFAYETSKGKQVIMVAMDPKVAVDDPKAQQAFDIVAAAWRQMAFYADRKLFALKPEPNIKPASGATARRKESKPGSNCRETLVTINTTQLQQVCYPSPGGMSNCQMQSVPVQRHVLQEQCFDR